MVKGVIFEGLKDIDDPVALSEYYNDAGADELVFYDITASAEQRGLFTDVMKRVAEKVFIPLTVGGGISSLYDFDRVLKNGADKVSVNSSAIRNPMLIKEAARHYGDQCVVLSMDVKRVNGVFTVFGRGGRDQTDINAIEWAQRGQELGAGEIVLNSMDADGVRGGFDIEMLNAVCEKVTIPVVASGGAGNIRHFIDLFTLAPGADAGLAASIFHSKEVSISDLKEHLHASGIPVRRIRK